jgi:hypothetical protein
MSSVAAPRQSDYESAVCGHADYYSALLATWGPRLRGAAEPDGGFAQLRSLRYLELELENLFVAQEESVRLSRPNNVASHAEHMSWLLDMLGRHQMMLQRYQYFALAA